MRRSFFFVLTTCSVFSMNVGANAGDNELEVIFSEATGSASATVPGARDLAGLPAFTEFKALEDLVVSADGSRWLVKGRSWQGDQLETMLLMGSGVTGSVFTQEGQPILGGEPGELWEFFDGAAGFDSAGNLAFGGRARNGDSSIKEKVLFYNAFEDSFTMVVTEGTPALNLLDLPPDPSGDELLGNSLNSIHLLEDGRVGFVAATIQNIHSSRRPAIFYDETSFRQTGVSAIGDETWDGFDSNAFQTTPDASQVLIRGDDEGPTGMDDILAYGGSPSAGGHVVVLREGTAVPGTKDNLAGIFDSKLNHGGSWFARGDFVDDTDWVVRDGELMARTGDPITTGSTELWGDVLLAFNGNANGDWVLAGNTNGDDPQRDSVLVLNGEDVLVREGDPVDLDGNGLFDDDAFIGRGNEALSSFSPNDIALTDDNVLYFFAPLRNAAGEDLGSFGSGGDAFMRMVIGGPVECVEDIAGNDNVVDTQDLLVLLTNWGSDGAGAAIAEPTDLVDTADLLGLLSAWGDCE